MDSIKSLDSLKKVTFYDFDLDLSPIDRWKFLFDEFTNYLPYLIDKLTEILNPYNRYLNLLGNVTSLLNKRNIMHYDEIKYIAHRLNKPLHEILLLQLLYEACTACTTIITKVNGKDFFLRTLDWPYDFLSDITIGLNIIRRGKIIGKSITWLGYVGFMTASNTDHCYSLAINSRQTREANLKTIIKNFYRTVTMNWPVGYMIRHVIENNLTTPEAKVFLTKTKLISPCYITMFVVNGESCVITRDCDDTCSIRTHDHSLTQTNCDFGKTEPDILYSVNRLRHIDTIVKKILDNPDREISIERLISKILQFPVYNEETVYVLYQYGNKINAYLL